MADLDKLKQALLEFRDEREWSQFHNPKDLALALSVEAAELLELYLWKKAEDADPSKVADELADIVSYAILLADKYDFDISTLVLSKIEKNKHRYPVGLAKGKSTKYSELK